MLDVGKWRAQAFSGSGSLGGFLVGVYKGGPCLLRHSDIRSGMRTVVNTSVGTSVCTDTLP